MELNVPPTPQIPKSTAIHGAAEDSSSFGEFDCAPSVGSFRIVHLLQNSKLICNENVLEQRLIAKFVCVPSWSNIRAHQKNVHYRVYVASTCMYVIIFMCTINVCTHKCVHVFVLRALEKDLQTKGSTPGYS